jgi:hypothetical protein
VTKRQVVRRFGTAHPRRHPARVDGVAEHVGPATAKANAVTNSLLSEYEPAERPPVQSDPFNRGRPLRCMPLLR